jgi:hypothetical protein
MLITLPFFLQPSEITTMGQIISAAMKNLQEPNEQEKSRKLEQLNFLQLISEFQKEKFEQDLKKIVSGDSGGIKVVKDSPLRHFSQTVVNAVNFIIFI